MSLSEKPSTAKKATEPPSSGEEREGGHRAGEGEGQKGMVAGEEVSVSETEAPKEQEVVEEGGATEGERLEQEKGVATEVEELEQDMGGAALDNGQGKGGAVEEEEEEEELRAMASGSNLDSSLQGAADEESVGVVEENAVESEVEGQGSNEEDEVSLSSA